MPTKRKAGGRDGTQVVHTSVRALQNRTHDISIANEHIPIRICSQIPSEQEGVKPKEQKNARFALISCKRMHSHIINICNAISTSHALKMFGEQEKQWTGPFFFIQLVRPP